MTGIGQYLLKVKSKCLKICLRIDIDASLFGVYVYMTWFFPLCFNFFSHSFKGYFWYLSYKYCSEKHCLLSQSLHLIIRNARKEPVREAQKNLLLEGGVSFSRGGVREFGKYNQQHKDVKVCLRRDWKIPVFAKLVLIWYTYANSMVHEYLYTTVFWFG